MIRKFYDVDLDGRSFGNAQPSGGKSAEFEHKERLDILEKHFGSDFYKTGQWHNAISDAMEQYAHHQPVVQLCPKCLGEGHLCDNISTTNPYRICPVCNGNKVLYMNINQQPVQAHLEGDSISIDELLSEFKRQGFDTTNWDGEEGAEKAIVDGVVSHFSHQPVQGYSEAEAIVKELAQWSEKYPRATVYPMTNKQIDEELITIEEKAKRFTSQQPVNDGWVRVDSERGCRTCKHIANDGKYPCNVCGDGDYVMYEPLPEPPKK